MRTPFMKNIKKTVQRKNTGKIEIVYLSNLECKTSEPH